MFVLAKQRKWCWYIWFLNSSNHSLNPNLEAHFTFDLVLHFTSFFQVDPKMCCIFNNVCSVKHLSCHPYLIFNPLLKYFKKNKEKNYEYMLKSNYCPEGEHRGGGLYFWSASCLKTKVQFPNAVAIMITDNNKNRE